VRAALAVIAGKAAFDGEVLPLHVRTAWHEDDLWYDLGDWRGVKIMAAGWEVVEQPPVLFRRLPHQRAQVEPVPGGNVRDILDLLTLKKTEHQCVLFLTDLVAGLVPGIPRPLSVFHGPHGSTKTTALRMKRELQDPVEVPVQGPPRDLAEFVQLASHNLCLFLDNLSSLPEWLSDALSRFCTGDGFTKRALYTTDEDYFYRPQGIGGLTGVNLVVTAPDLLDRSFIYQMDRLAEGEYLPESELRQRFEAMKPGLLGAMFSTLSAAVGLHPQLKARPLPRLADYALWAVASAIALGYDERDYWQAYAANIGAQTREALDASPVAQAVLHLMDGRKEWSGTPSELLLALNAIAEELKIDSKARAWPKDAGWVTRRLTLVLPNLAQVGIQVRTSHDGKNRQVALQRKGNDVSGVSPVSGHKEGVNTTNGTNIKTGTPGGKVGQKQERPIDPCLCPREEWTEGVIGESCPTCEYKLRCPECGGCRTCGHKLAREHADD